MEKSDKTLWLEISKAQVDTIGPPEKEGFCVMRLSGKNDADIRIGIVRPVVVDVETIRLEFACDDKVAIRRPLSLLSSLCFTEDLL